MSLSTLSALKGIRAAVFHCDGVNATADEEKVAAATQTENFMMNKDSEKEERYRKFMRQCCGV